MRTHKATIAPAAIPTFAPLDSPVVVEEDTADGLVVGLLVGVEEAILLGPSLAAVKFPH